MRKSKNVSSWHFLLEEEEEEGEEGEEKEDLLTYFSLTTYIDRSIQYSAQLSHTFAALFCTCMPAAAAAAACNFSLHEICFYDDIFAKMM